MSEPTDHEADRFEQSDEREYMVTIPKTRYYELLEIELRHARGMKNKGE
jgi:hypothetical protein